MNPPAPVTKTLTELLNVLSPISCVRSKDPHYSRTHFLELLLKVRDYHRESQGLKYNEREHPYLAARECDHLEYLLARNVGFRASCRTADCRLSSSLLFINKRTVLLGYRDST